MIGLNASDLMESLNEAFGWLQARDLRVGKLWLNRREAELLIAQREHFDPVSSLQVQEAISEQVGARFLGHLWGANVFEASEVPEGHLAIVPDDFDAKLIGSAACMPLLRVGG